MEKLLGKGKKKRWEKRTEERRGEKEERAEESVTFYEKEGRRG